MEASNILIGISYAGRSPVWPITETIIITHNCPIISFRVI